MSKSGSYVYVPKIIMEELKNIKIEDGIESRSEAFKRMTKYARLGRTITKKENRSFPI